MHCRREIDTIEPARVVGLDGLLCQMKLLATFSACAVDLPVTKAHKDCTELSAEWSGPPFMARVAGVRSMELAGACRDCGHLGAGVARQRIFMINRRGITLTEQAAFAHRLSIYRDVQLPASTARLLCD